MKPHLDIEFEVDKGRTTNQGCCKECYSILSRLRKEFRFTEYSKINPSKVEKLTDHQYQICAAFVPAFVVKLREWSQCPRLSLRKIVQS